MYGDEGVARLVRSYTQGIDTDEALKSALDTDFDRLQATFDQFNDRVFAKLRPALQATAKDEELQSMPLSPCGPSRRRTRRASSGRWRSAGRC